MAKKNKHEQYKIFNREIILILSLFIILSLFSISCFQSNDTEIAVLFFIGAILAFLCAFLFPIYFVFSSKSLTAVWLLPFKKTIHWSSVSIIIEQKSIEYSLFSSAIDLPHYEIMYHYNYKGEETTKELDLPRNRKTKKLIEKYAKSKIV